MGCSGCRKARTKFKKRLSKTQTSPPSNNKPEPELSPRAARIKARAERMAIKNARLIARKARLEARAVIAKKADLNG